MIKGTAVNGDVIFTIPASTECCYEITFWENLNTPWRCKALLMVGANGDNNYSISYPVQTNGLNVAYTTSTRAVRLVMRTY